MFYIKEPSEKKSPWILSHNNDEKVVSIPADTLKDTRSYQILGIDFLYQNYKNQFKGAILNEEEGMNIQFQVATFLNAMLNYVEPKFLVLIIVPDRYIVNWHYHLCIHAGLKVQLITPKTCPEDFDQEHGLALLLPFSNIKLAEYLIDYDYFSVIIDHLDEVASKLIIRKLRGVFNIGLTQRNFYTDPDQKLQWTMLNWSNPGYVGKLGEFYEIDNDNFANFRDNYRTWWFRLTWNYCDSFRKPTDQEELEYTKMLSKWSLSHHLPSEKREEKVKKRKQVQIISSDKQDENIGEKRRKTAKSVEVVVNFKEEKATFKGQETERHSETCHSPQDVKLESPDLEKARGPNYVKLPSMDENPILNSIIRTLETSPEPILMQHTSFTQTAIKFNVDEPNCSKAFEDENILLSIINDETPVTEELALNIKKEELRSQIFCQEACTSKSLTREEDSEFFQSLMEPDVPFTPNTSMSTLKGCRSDDIERILRETEVLLKQ